MGRMIADRKPLTKQTVEGIKPEPGRDVFLWDGGDGAVKGFGVRVSPSGKRSYIYQYRVKGAQRRKVLGVHGALTVQKARDMARDLYELVRKGRDPVAEQEAEREQERIKAEAKNDQRTVTNVLDQFIARYATANQLRSKREYERAFDRLVKPAIGEVEIHALRRSQIAEMIDQIEDGRGGKNGDEGGPVMADRTLAYLRKALNWYASRDDEFNNPIAKGMARTKPRERARTRTLSDDEVSALWAVTEAQGFFGAFVRVLLLSAQRRSEVAYMCRGEITADGTWSIPAERYKTKRSNVVPLSVEALAIIEAQPARPDGYVFSPTYATHGKPKAKLDDALKAANDGKPFAPWTLHDLRRTAKTLMVRAGVSNHVSERVLGHVIAGVEGVYDQYDYLQEKRDALKKLAGEIDRIVNPHPQDNVVPPRSAAE
jgi:integrase